MADFDKYRGPNVAVDVAVLTRAADALAVLIQNRMKNPRGKVLPGRFLREGETVSDGLRAALWEKAGLEVGPIDAALDHGVAESDSTNPTKAHLVGVFDKPGRDRRSTWSMSLAHYLVLPLDRLNGAKGEFVPIRHDGSVEPELLFDHDAIVREAARDLRAQYELTPDPENLWTDREITLPDLQDVHEAVLGERVRVDTFRRRMEALLDEAIDPDDPKGRRKKTRPSGPSGGPPTRLWAKRSLFNGVPGEANRLLRLPRAVD
jgi:8-oxo-dGTP diphosphatase